MPTVLSAPARRDTIASSSAQASAQLDGAVDHRNASSAPIVNNLFLPKHTRHRIPAILLSVIEAPYHAPVIPNRPDGPRLPGDKLEELGASFDSEGTNLAGAKPTYFPTPHND